MKKVSVVILNWNGEKLLQQFLPSILKNTDTQLASIIVADNYSTDNSIGYISEHFPTIEIIRLPQNYGYAKGYNEALENIQSEYSVLLNSDVEVTPNWLEPIISALDNDSTIVAAQPLILSYRNKKYFEYAGAAGGFIDKYGYPFCRGRIFGKVEENTNQYNNPIDIFWATGACMVIKTKEFKAAGGFDPSFFAHMEEIDLCWRLNVRGKRIICIPQSTVYHVGAATLSTESPRKTFLNFRNNLLMLYKNLPEDQLKKVIRARKVLDYLAAIQLLVSGKRKNYQAIIAAHKEFKKIKKNYTNLRRENIQKASLLNIKTIYPKSLLWNFYIKNKKEFSKLNFKP